MDTAHGVRRAIVVVLDGVRPDAIELFDLPHLRRLAGHGAFSLHATTVMPSVTTAAMTSLLTGVAPATHGILTDRVFIPRDTSHLTPVPALLSSRGFPTAAFMAEVPSVFRGVVSRVGKRFGFDTAQASGRSGAEILMASRSTLRTQRRGLVLYHWPDADRAGHEHGWMSDAYAHACHNLDRSLGALCDLVDAPADSRTLLVVLADHGGGGVASNDHDADHRLNRTIPLIFAGGGVASVTLTRPRLLDVAPTLLHALGVDVPRQYEGQVLSEAFGGVAADAAVA